ncbi:MAG: glycosyltransferase family protein [Nannocystaceae bacterium]
MATYALFVHGRGRGHASRARGLLVHLRGRGHRVIVYAGGDALDLLDRDPELVRVDPVLPGPSALWTAPRRVSGDRRALAELRPDAVVSDGDAPSIRAARALGLPTVAIGHDQVFRRCDLRPGSSLARAHERAIAGLTSGGAERAVAVHFLPITTHDPKTMVSRPDPPRGLRGPIRAGGGIVTYLRDGESAGFLAALAGRGRRVVAFGPMNDPPPGVELRAFDGEAFHAALLGADAVIGTAGSNLLAECVLLGKPILALHGRRDHEQRLNALLAARAGVAVAAALGDDPRAAVDALLARSDAGDFARVDLAAALPPASLALERALALTSGSSP